MKTLNWLAWTSTGIGLLIILLGVIPDFFFDTKILPVTQVSSVFAGANSFFLISIVLFVYQIKCQCRKE